MAEVEHLEVRQAAERGGNGPGQTVVVEAQPRDPAGGVGRHAVPLAQRGRGLPARGVPPAGPAGGVVERLEHLAVAPRPGRRGGRHRYPLFGRQAVRIAGGHRHRRRPRRARHEPDGVSGHEGGDGFGPARRGRVGQLVFVGVGEPVREGHAGGRPRLGQGLRGNRTGGLGGAVAGVAEELDGLQPRLERGVGGRARRRPRDAEHREPRQGGQTLRKRAGQGVEREVQGLEAAQVAQRGGDRAGQGVPEEGEPLEAAQAAQRGGDRAGQDVLAEVQHLEARQAAQGGRDRPRQVVLAEGHPPEAGQVAEARGKRAGQGVVAEVRDLERRQISQPGRERAGEAVVPQRETHDPARRVGGHPVPAAQRGRGLPPRVVRPARAASRVVQRLERRPVGRGAPLRQRAGDEPRPDHGRGDEGEGTLAPARHFTPTYHLRHRTAFRTCSEAARLRRLRLPRVIRAERHPTRGAGAAESPAAPLRVRVEPYEPQPKPMRV